MRLGHAVITFQKLIVVEAQVGNAIAGTNAGADESGCKPLRSFAETAISELLIAGNDADLFGKQLNSAVQKTNWREWDEHGAFASVYILPRRIGFYGSLEQTLREIVKGFSPHLPL